MIITDTFSNIPIKGVFSYKVYNRNKQLVFVYEDPNLVVGMSKEILAKLIAGDSDKFITKLAVGNDQTTPTPDDLTIGTIATTDLVLGNNVLGEGLAAFAKTIDDISYPEFGEVTFEWSLDYSEANGLDICEFGLLTDDQNLFARKTRGAIVKQSDLAFEGTWRIVF